MLILTHVLIALASVGYTTLLFFFPTQTKFRVSYGLMAATLGSGTYLVISTHAPMLRACVTGLLYTGLVSLGIILAHRRYAMQHSDNT